MTLSNRWIALLAGTLLVLHLNIVRAADPGPGDTPPPDLGLTLAGDHVLLPGYAGKAVIVSFCATWCGYCLKELPILENIQNRAGKDQIAVVAVNTEAFEVYRRATAIMRESMHLELVSDASGDAQRAFGVHAIPHMLIIGRDGRILSVHRGYDEKHLGAIAADINKALRPLP